MLSSRSKCSSTLAELTRAHNGQHVSTRKRRQKGITDQTGPNGASAFARSYPATAASIPRRCTMRFRGAPPRTSALKSGVFGFSPKPLSEVSRRIGRDLAVHRGDGEGLQSTHCGHSPNAWNRVSVPSLLSRMGLMPLGARKSTRPKTQDIEGCGNHTMNGADNDNPQLSLGGLITISRQFAPRGRRV